MECYTQTLHHHHHRHFSMWSICTTSWSSSSSSSSFYGHIEKQILTCQIVVNIFPLPLLLWIENNIPNHSGYSQVTFVVGGGRQSVYSPVQMRYFQYVLICCSIPFIFFHIWRNVVLTGCLVGWYSRGQQQRWLDGWPIGWEMEYLNNDGLLNIMTVLLFWLVQMSLKC